MKGEIGVNPMMFIVLALAIGLVLVSLFATQTGRAEEAQTNSSNLSNNTSMQAGCHLTCREQNPSRGPSYYQCLENRGCS